MPFAQYNQVPGGMWVYIKYSVCVQYCISLKTIKKYLRCKTYCLAFLCFDLAMTLTLTFGDLFGMSVRNKYGDRILKTFYQYMFVS